MTVPSHRSDVDQLNDLAEEITRMIGYDNIPSQAFGLTCQSKENKRSLKNWLVEITLVNNGFFEVINNPFNDNQDEEAIAVDNPLDKQRSKMSTLLNEFNKRKCCLQPKQTKRFNKVI